MKEKLINFLKINDVYDAFISNVANEALDEVIERNEIAEEKGFAINIIGVAFDWSKSPEGKKFWASVSEKWDCNISIKPTL